MMKADSRDEKIPVFNAVTGKVEEIDRVVKSDAQWKKILPPDVYRVTRRKETEPPFSGSCGVPTKGGFGVYKCADCGLDLFAAGSKFESGTGWPSFWDPVSSLNIKEEPDDSMGMRRTEILCARCDAHLGHVFYDGPAPTHRRYCINAAALKFLPLDKAPCKTSTAIFAAGCFWGVEEAFRNIKGVKYTVVGYTDGTVKNPTYEKVCSGNTGHAESVEVIYDPAEVSYDGLLDAFWKMHDPTTINRQGPDIGAQYRSAIFYTDDDQKAAAIASKDKAQKALPPGKAIATEITTASEFYPAEGYHQKYYMKHGIKSCPR